MSTASSQVDLAMRFHGASDEEYADQNVQSSVLSQCGSRPSPSIASVEFSDFEPLQNPTDVPFETCAQELGSHLAYESRPSEPLDMFLELELFKFQHPPPRSLQTKDPRSMSVTTYAMNTFAKSLLLSTISSLTLIVHTIRDLSEVNAPKEGQQLSGNSGSTRRESWTM
ncbi:MAG: hypothetical protein Q9196_003737 [Gyalolechia fulgens]